VGQRHVVGTLSFMAPELHSTHFDRVANTEQSSSDGSLRWRSPRSSFDGEDFMQLSPKEQADVHFKTVKMNMVRRMML
jgi:hypothetical protein